MMHSLPSRVKAVMTIVDDAKCIVVTRVGESVISGFITVILTFKVAVR